MAETGFALNCRFFEKSMGGIGRYATGIVNEFKRRDAGVRLLASRHVLPAHEAQVESAGVERVGRLRGHLWEQWDLPVRLRRLGSPALLNVVNTAPLVYRRQATVVHDLSYLRMPEAFSRSFRWFYRIMIPRAVAVSARVITDSEFSKREIVELLGVAGDRVTVVYPFVGDEMRRLAGEGGHGRAADQGDYVLMVSSLNPRKNLRRALAAFHAAAVPGLRLVLVGASRAAFNTPGIADLVTENVELRSDISDRELVALYTGARLFLYPSLYEGFGIPPLEAMICGCPVVASRAASLPEVCGEAAHYVDPYRSDDIAAGIRLVAESETVRTNLIRQGREVAARFTVERAAQQLIQVMRGVAADE